MKFNHTAHVAMWKWMMEQWEAYSVHRDIPRLKTQYAKEISGDGITCYACDYCEGYCHACPLKAMKRCNDASLYGKLFNAQTKAEWVRLCKAIRDREVNAGVECE